MLKFILCELRQSTDVALSQQSCTVSVENIFFIVLGLKAKPIFYSTSEFFPVTVGKMAQTNLFCNCQATINVHKDKHAQFLFSIGYFCSVCLYEYI